MKNFKYSFLLLTFSIVLLGCQREPTADFILSKTTASVGESITFTNNSSNSDHYIWEFGDGESSTSKNATHSYSDTGEYSVKLVAYNKNGKINEKIMIINIEGNTGIYIDSRDGQIYSIVKIGNQWWMAENLNYYTENGSWAYDNNPSNSKIYGRLYDWETACEVCPVGWHLPSDEEWKTLERYLGMDSTDANDTDFRGTNEGDKIKEEGTLHWTCNTHNANNQSGYNALPGGFKYDNDGIFTRLGENAEFWSATEVNDSQVWIRFLYCNNEKICRVAWYKGMGISVRCVKD